MQSTMKLDLRGYSMINKLVTKTKKTEAPIVVGLDPMLNYLPKRILDAKIAEYGETMKAAGRAIVEYNKGLIDAIYDLVPAMLFDVLVGLLITLNGGGILLVYVTLI